MKVSQGQLQDIWPFTKVGNTRGRAGLEEFAGTGHIKFQVFIKHSSKHQIDT